MMLIIQTPIKTTGSTHKKGKHDFCYTADNNAADIESSRNENTKKNSIKEKYGLLWPNIAEECLYQT